MSAVRVEINGITASAEQLAALLAANYGNYTTMQVQARQIRGLAMHLQRLDLGSRELFGTSLPDETVRGYLRQALRDIDGAASVRVNVFSSKLDREHPGRSMPVDVMVTVGPPPPAGGASVRVCAQAYERELPQVKHVATFGLLYQRRVAQLAGFDDALFVDRQGRISEGSVWNIGFWDGAQLVWPQAAMLEGVSMRLLQEGLRVAGVASVTREIRLADLRDFRAAFLCNANRVGIPIIAIDEQEFAEDAALTELLARCYASMPAESI